MSLSYIYLFIYYELLLFIYYEIIYLIIKCNFLYIFNKIIKNMKL